MSDVILFFFFLLCLNFPFRRDLEYGTMVELNKKFVSDSNEICARRIKNSVFLPQLGNFYDENIYWNKTVSISHD